MAALAASRAEPLPPGAAPITGCASGSLNGVPTHCFCARFGDYSTVFFSQAGGVGRVLVADGAAGTAKMGGDDPLADLLARKVSEAVSRRVVVTVAVRNLKELADVRALVELFESVR